MMRIIDILNKIKWDSRENPDDYTILYHDRILKTLIEINYTDIKRIEDSFMVVEREDEPGKETMIPIHRIRKIKKKGVVVWSRPDRKI